MLSYFKGKVGKLIIHFILSSFLAINLYSQSSFFKTSDTLKYKRVIGLTALYGSVWSGSIVSLNQVWYANYPKAKFHTFNDDSEWMQMDKFGHIFTAYHISKSLTSLNRWSGINKSTSAIIGSTLAWSYQLTLELLDGKSAEWGFSWGDMTANTIGAGVYLSQELLFKDQLLLLKQSYHPTYYALIRPEILGSTTIERYFKDYNGQTYWFSISPRSIWKSSKIPSWLLFSIGYGVDAKISGKDNSYLLSNGQVLYAKRKYLLSLDIDLAKLPLKNKLLKRILKPLNAIKIPLPTLIWQNGICYGNAFYF